MTPDISSSSGTPLNLRSREYIDTCVLLIVGGGITGLAKAYTDCRFTNLKDICVIEKYHAVAQVNSNSRNNAQSRHRGVNETNYNLIKALKMLKDAGYLGRYAESKNDPALMQRRLMMAVAVTKKEVERLEQRYVEFKPYYPDIRLVYREEMIKIEPNLIKGRKGKHFCALVSNGDIVNFQLLTEYLKADCEKLNPQFRCYLKTEVLDVKRVIGGYEVTTNRGIIFAKMIEFAAGPYSLLFAHKLGYGKDLSILPVRGHFYSSGHWVDNKIYPMQVEGRPFAEPHADPDIVDMNDTRWGPTTEPVPLMESGHPETFLDFIKLRLITSLLGIASLFAILWKNKLTWYVTKNFIYVYVPVIGKWLFLNLEARKLVPLLPYSALKLRKGAGGIRPQIVNLKTMNLEMGDATIVGNGEPLIFNTTPSPGASASFGNAYRDTKIMIGFAGSGYYFDEEKFQKELG